MDILPKNADNALGHLPFYIFWMVFSTISCFGFFVVVSMLVLGCAFQYGSVSERVDDTSILHEIEDLEKWADTVRLIKKDRFDGETVLINKGFSISNTVSMLEKIFDQI